MAEASARTVWIGRGVYVALCLLIIFIQLLPLETLPPSWGNGGVLLPDGPRPDALLPDGSVMAVEPVPRRWAGPDILLLVTLVWAARRPDYLPAFLVAGIFLLADFLFQRPPGLWAALVLIFTEILRSRARNLRVVPFPLEWAGIAAGVIAITLINRFTLMLVLVPQAPLGLTLVQLVLTLAFYPAVVFGAYLIGVSRPAAGEVDALGHRL